MRLRYTISAARDLERILDSIERDSPQGAMRVKQRLHSVIALLQQYPNAGRLTTKGRLRRVVAYPYPYLVYYLATDDEIVIHGVRHGARKPSSMPDESA